jgi:hypothetical protein
MEWIEKLLHISPDGGNGLFESLIFSLVLFGIAAPHVLRRRRIRRNKQEPGEPERERFGD